jgi:hypothetical protein
MAKKSIDNEYDEVELTEDDFKIDLVPKTYVLLEKFWDFLEDNLPRNKSALIRFIGSYRNKFISKLETPYPIDYPPWTPACRKILYASTGIDEDDFVDAVLTIRGHEGYVDPYLKDKAEYILALMIARWFMQHDYDKELKIMQHFIGYSHYWAVFTNFFKRYKPKPEVMKYTINEMSYKSRLKVLGSVDKWLQDGVMNGMNTYKERLNRASDFELHYINEKIRSKFKSAMKTIYRAQEKNEKEKKYIFTSSSHMGDDIIDNTYGVAEVISLASSFTTKFFADPITEKALKGALIPGGITEKDLRNVILMISDDKKNLDDVSKLYQSLFYIFLENDKYTVRDIGGNRFYYEMEKLYKPGNTNDPNRNYIKTVLDKWLSMGSTTFRSTNRTATITTFRKSIYEYFVLKIMYDK